MMSATVYVAVRAACHTPALDKDYLIILGCRMRDDGTPSGILRSRLDAAISLADLERQETGHHVTFVPSGGQGPDEPLAEATSMQNYLLDKHFPSAQIIPESRSKSTFQNFQFSQRLIQKSAPKDASPKVAFATTDYHVFRSGVLATNLGFQNIEGVGAKSPWYFYNNALIREFIANLNSERHFHLFNVSVLIFAVAVLITTSYVFNIL